SSSSLPQTTSQTPGLRRRLLQKLVRLPRIWWSHKVALAISSALTVLGLFIYRETFILLNPPAIFEPIQRLEFNALDTRFRFRGPSARKPDPNIVIVDIDQHSQEVLGRWPFSRTHFADMLDVLRESGAKVVAFDITFSKPDEVLTPIRELHEE